MGDGPTLNMGWKQQPIGQPNRPCLGWLDI
jgi:hypothetical protein